MIKNQLYPFIEKYINEYLFGFTKEQLNIGVMNGQIQLDNLIIRPDSTNQKLNELDLPIWLKAGMIKKIHIGCSIMNFLGEKPLEITINEIDMIISPSFKWINRNISSYIVELENHIREMYDPIDNNSSDIFKRKINFFDSTVYLKMKKSLIKIFNDETFFSRIIVNIYNKVLRFFYKKSYLIKLTMKNINIRFEDDTFNFYGNIVFGLKINMFEFNLSIDGVNKKDNFKLDGIELFWEGPNPKILLPSKLLNDNLDVDNKIKDDRYYNIVRKINISKSSNLSNKIIEGFNFCGNFGISIVESKNIDFFSKVVEKNYNFYLQIATSELKLTIYPQLIQIIENFLDYAKSYYIIEQVQDFKPMRRPYDRTNELVIKFKENSKFKRKRKMIVRDWFYYMIWFLRIKKAIYGNYFQNDIHEEFSKYFSITYNSFSSQNTANFNPENKEENINPDNVNLNLSIEILLKAINITLMNPSILKNLNNQEEETLNLRIQGIENKLYLKNKQNAEFIFNLNSMILSTSNQILIDKNLEETLIKNLKLKQKNIINEQEEKQKPLKKINKIFTQETFSDDSEEIYSDEKLKHDKNGNNKLILLNDILSGIDSKNNNIQLRRHNDNKSEISGITSQTNTCRSLLKVFIKNDPSKDKKTIQKNKKLKNLELSKKIYELNKEILKKNSSPIKFEGILEPKRSTSNNYTLNTNEKLKLNLFEIKSSNNECSLKFNVKKELIQGKISEKINLTFDLIRCNIVPSLTNSCLNTLVPFLKILGKLFNIYKLTEKFNVSDKVALYEIKKYCINKLNNLESYEAKQYADYLSFTIEAFSLFSMKTPEIDYAFYLIMNNNYEINVNYNDLFVLGIDFVSKSQNIKETIIESSSAIDFCKIRIPDIDLTMKFNESSIYSKLFDMEFKYSNLDKWKNFLSNFVTIIKSQFSQQITLIFPYMKRIFSVNKNQQFNEESEINNIINSNLRSLKIDHNNGEYTDRTEELKCLSASDD